MKLSDLVSYSCLSSFSPLPLQGWYIVTYALAIYHLNLLLAFLTPKIDPALAEFEAEEGKERRQL